MTDINQLVSPLTSYLIEKCYETGVIKIKEKAKPQQVKMNSSR